MLSVHNNSLSTTGASCFWLLCAAINNQSSITASASISTSQAGSMNRTTCIMVLAGRISEKNWPCTRATFSQSSIRVRRILVRMTSDKCPPKPSMAAWIISRVRRACAVGSPIPTVLPSGPSGAVPVTAIMRPLRTAREIPTFGSKGEPVEIRCRVC